MRKFLAKWGLVVLTYLHQQRITNIGCMYLTCRIRDGWMDGYFIYRRSTLKGHIASNDFYII